MKSIGLGKSSTMTYLTKLRILGYIVTITMHMSNFLYMGWLKRNYPTDNEMVKQFKSLEYRFFTTWTFVIQIVYAIYSLGCDIVLLKNAKKRDYKLSTPISDLRELVFAGILWPSSMVVFTVFWGIYSIDRALIFPEFLDAVIPPISNHIIHTMIVPVVLWEVITRPRKEPENHARNVSQLTLHLCVYVSVMYFTYLERGIWLYPIFRKLFGTVYFYFALAGIATLFYIFYALQWPLTNWIHAKKKVEKKKSRYEKRKMK
ncbi:hypothetical protein PYW07_011714 [Mythimna separata]|uniref:Androgen-dependent TFPI-regulating protein-like n=1 Tax=Mythimna separata TaxID=271217 RepID=A0AAD7Y6P4_MYTSE|nr:hypothetical protein PYW07_011714 [Mythimna separata]